jgi:hypothetical protein
LVKAQLISSRLNLKLSVKNHPMPFIRLVEACAQKRVPLLLSKAKLLQKKPR